MKPGTREQIRSSDALYRIVSDLQELTPEDREKLRDELRKLDQK